MDPPPPLPPRPRPMTIRLATPDDDRAVAALYTPNVADYAVHAGISLSNPASVGLHEALGFVPVGVFRAVGHKLGGWHDVGWWQLELAPRQGVPDPPRSLPSLGVSAPDRVAVALGAGQLTSRR